LGCGIARPDDTLLCFLACGAVIQPAAPGPAAGGHGRAPPRGDCGGYSLRDRKFRGLSRHAGLSGRYLACSRVAGLNSRYPAGGLPFLRRCPCVAAIAIGRQLTARVGNHPASARLVVSVVSRRPPLRLRGPLPRSPSEGGGEVRDDAQPCAINPPVPHTPAGAVVGGDPRPHAFFAKRRRSMLL
jgi:hypothetical protein